MFNKQQKLARKHGISKKFRQYAKRYGVDVEGILQMHRKYKTPPIL
jgi:hypothetical protein